MWNNQKQQKSCFPMSNLQTYYFKLDLILISSLTDTGPHTAITNQPEECKARVAI